MKKKILKFFEPYKVTTSEDVDDNGDNWWWSAIIVLLICALATFCPRRCYAGTVPCDTIPIAWEQVDTIFQRNSASGKTTKYYVVYTYKGYKDITSISKTALEYIQMCKSYGITPKIGLRCKKNGEVVSIVVIKKRRL